MSKVEQMLELVAVLDYPTGDVRLQFAARALEVAEVIDRGGPPVNYVRAPEWLLEYVIQDLAQFPNAPPMVSTEIRLRMFDAWWRGYKRQAAVGDP